ncbi:MAG: hypothetical protein GC134_09945 [Proteobacteria bacterium]|nr:hypothetical protein [Pseudomonadota bacterium]
MVSTRLALVMCATALSLGGCKYYGGALPPDNPVSMDEALDKSANRAPMLGPDGKPIILARPKFDRPSYIPEKELAVVAPPKTLLVWTYPHVTEDNTRVFGNWSTIFLTDKYEWVLPANEKSVDDGVGGGTYGGQQQ